MILSDLRQFYSTKVTESKAQFASLALFNSRNNFYTEHLNRSLVISFYKVRTY